jgi:hypothetical protein
MRSFIHSLLSATFLCAAVPAYAQIGPIPGATSFTDPLIFGTGSDGTATAVGCGALSSGTVTLTRDINCSSITLSGTAAIQTNGFRIYVNGTLDISNAQTGAIVNTATGNVYATVPHILTGRGSIAGGTGNGTGGAQGYPIAQGGSFGGYAGTSGAGGASGGNTGGATASNIAAIGAQILLPNPLSFSLITFGNTGTVLANAAGYSGSSGGAGAGDGTNAGGAGGPGGAGGGAIYIAAYTIARGANTNASIIQTKGVAGTNGSNGAGGNAGGGGGGSGGGGGFIYIVVNSLTGSAIANALDVSGGTGGTGGTGQGTGKGGGGAAGGNGGQTQIVNTGASTFTVSSWNAAGTAGSTTSTATGGAGGAGATQQSNL